MVRRSARNVTKSKDKEQEVSDIETVSDSQSQEEEWTVEKLVDEASAFILSKINSKRPAPLSAASSFLGLSSDAVKDAKDPTELASELESGLDMDNLYLKFDKNHVETDQKTFVQEPQEKLMSKSVITDDFEKKDVAPPMHVSKSMIQKQKKKQRQETAGPKWFNLPATPITPELKQDLKIMKMRNVLDPKRHYKKSDSKELPKYFQVGTVVEGAADFYHSRIPQKQRKRTLVDELLANEEFRKRSKKKFLEYQKLHEGSRKKFHPKKKSKVGHRGRR